MTESAERLQADVLREAFRSARQDGGHPMELLGERTGLGEAELLRLFAAEMDIPFRGSLDAADVPPSFISGVPIGYARRHGVVVVDERDGGLSMATSDPLDFAPLDAVGRALDRAVLPVLAPRDEVLRAVETAYEREMRDATRVTEDLGDLEGLVDQSAALARSEDLLELSRRPPLIRLVNRLFLQALEQGASDIHFQPLPECLQVRQRVDGYLHDMVSLPKEIQAAVVSRVKVMGEMDIAEKRLAQDGRSTVTIGRRSVDLRISSMPTSDGEQIVVRLLDKASRLLTLDELGMSADTLEEFRPLIHAPHGIVLVTGPTGSGKTTTLYAALQELDTRSTHIVTLEDPIEYRLEGINQTQVNYKKGLTFANGLRNVLRQDPDIIMVGEIRDQETARMAVQSALTGHLVLSTLHTNDAVSATTRLLDLDIEPYLVSSALLGVVAQRLVRRVCPECAVPAEPDGSLVRRAGLEGREAEFLAGEGCEACFQTGYRGRVGIFELLRVDEDLSDRIAARRTASEMRKVLRAGGFHTLRADGIQKALEGITTLEEVFRVTQDDEA